ncbi:MAG TPA: HNH endonuclease signature motif containing protein [Telluria sp.]|jgi:hypothetical protein
MSTDWNAFLRYDEITGVLSWKVKRPGPKTAVGQEVGSVKHDGRYRSFVLFHKRHYTHRVIWEMVNGAIPDGMCIDHLDGDGLNNRLANLRITTLSGNQRNRRIAKNNRTGVAGVTNHKNGYSVSCASLYVGHFKTFDAAVAARKEAEVKHGYLENNRGK